MSVDFVQLKLKLNYNNSGNPFLQYGPITGNQPPEEFQAGWTEVYDMPAPTGSPSQSLSVSAANAINLIAARASLLALNYYIKDAVIHQASIFKSGLPLPGSARFGGIDGSYYQDQYGNVVVPSLSDQYCSNAEETIILRQESASLRSWERQIRGIKDNVSDDSMSSFPALSWGPTQSTIFDAVFPAVQVPPGPISPPQQLDYKLVGTGLVKNSNTIVAPTAYTLAVNGVYPLSITDPTGSGAYGTFTIAAGAITTWSFTMAGAGYTAPVVTAPLTADAGGLQLYQGRPALWANFAACLQAYTGSGQHQRVLNTSFPSGYMTQLNNTPPLAGYYATQRVLIQRVGNRQTGQIRLTSPARKKRGI